MDKKYELIKENDYYRIKALKNFQLITGEVIRKGDFGGLVQGKHNLSQEGNCWINLNAIACHNSKVIDNAVMKDNSRVFDNSTISGNAVMNGVSKAYDHSTISGNAVMEDCSIAYKDSTITGNALLQADQHIHYGTVTTDLLGTKDLVGALYAELGLVPKDNKVVLYKKVWSTDDKSIFESIYDKNFLYKIGETVVAEDVDEDIFKSCARGLHFTSLEFVNCCRGDTIIECEVEVPDVVTVQDSKVRARKCRVIGNC